MLFSKIIIEEEVEEHPLTREICQRYPDLPKERCERFGEVFNVKKQNFREQKQAPALILAKKYGKLVLPTPEAYGIGTAKNFYFSHMYNCVYDCRYCFLQGLFRSANYVLFVNSEDFAEAIEEASGPDTTFFSGYHCDSLALESVTHFMERFLPVFERNSSALFELRTKSSATRFLEQRPPLPNVVVAFSLNPEVVVESVEHRTPSLARRLGSIKRLHSLGWPIGFRFDPVMSCPNYEEVYKEFFAQVFSVVSNPHSVTLGGFRMPKPYMKTISRLYPEETLAQDEGEVVDVCRSILKTYISEEQFFPCV